VDLVFYCTNLEMISKNCSIDTTPRNVCLSLRFNDTTPSNVCESLAFFFNLNLTGRIVRWISIEQKLFHPHIFVCIAVTAHYIPVRCLNLCLKLKKLNKEGNLTGLYFYNAMTQTRYSAVIFI
jgi:hypothetical protein